MPKSQTIETVTNQLKDDILKGAFRPYNILPTRRALADQFETTPDTIAKVLKNLEVEGLLSKGKGHTMHVLAPRERVTTNEETFRDYMKAQGHTVKVEHIATPGVIPATPQLAKLFRVVPETPLVERARREIVDGTVYRYSRKYYLASLVSEDVLEQIRQDHTFNVRAILEEQVPVFRIQERLIARTVTDKEESDILQAARGVPVMEQWKINYAENKTVTSVSLVVFNAAYFVKTYDYSPGNEPKLSNFVTSDNGIAKTTSDFN
jgi:DNA-binding GntR family transcriptional regulator